MSTRRLIAVALIAGLAILLAGGIQLVLLAGGDDEGEGSGRRLWTVGESVVVDGVRTSVAGARRDGPQLVLTVTFAAEGGAQAPAADVLARGWALSAPDAKPVPRVDDAQVPGRCPGTPVGADEVRCDVGFAVGDDPRSGSYLAALDGSQFWVVPLPAT